MRKITDKQLQTLFKQYKIGLRLQKSLRFSLDDILWDGYEFVTLTNKQGNEGVILSEVPGVEIASYELRKRGANAQGRTAAIICDICATWQAGPRSATITFKKPGMSASFLVCADLACCKHVRDMTDDAKTSRAQLREDIDVDGRIARIERNLARILR